MNKVLIDTNIIIYHSNQESKFYPKIVEYFTSTNDLFFIPSKVISEYYAVCSKLNVPFNEAFEHFTLFKANCEILYVDFISVSIFEKLLRKYNPVGNQVFDIEIASVMLANDMDFIYTYNYRDFEFIEDISILKV